MHQTQQVKIIGHNGQLTLGKAFADQMVSIGQADDGVWIIKVGESIPASEKWLYSGDHLARLNKVLSWTTKNEPKDNFEEIAERIESAYCDAIKGRTTKEKLKEKVLPC